MTDKGRMTKVEHTDTKSSNQPLVELPALLIIWKSYLPTKVINSAEIGFQKLCIERPKPDPLVMREPGLGFRSD